MYLLGIAGQVQDASVALLRDGEIVAAAEEERFSRQKFMGMMQVRTGIPERALQSCLEQGGITIDDVDHICYFFRPYHELLHQWAFDLTRRALKNPVAAGLYMFQKAEVFKSHFEESPTSPNATEGAGSNPLCGSSQMPCRHLSVFVR